MARKLLKSLIRVGNLKPEKPEKIVQDINFNVIKLNSRPKPNNPKQIIFICCFSEFGCETVGSMYCIPRILQDHPGKYKIVIGWHGREYLYRHLVDEFWEIKPEFMWLREYSKGFHHNSKNLKKIENSLKQYGITVPSDYLGRIAISAKCRDCKLFFNTVYYEENDSNVKINNSKICPKCKSCQVTPAIYGDVNYWKNKAIRIPEPSKEKVLSCLKYIKKPSVAVFARGRNCYGRNLQPEFYEKLILTLEEMGYNPIWLGEKSTGQPCPIKRIVDFSKMEESRDLESTLAIIKNCEFTIQFWTASTRLSGVLGVPYILFESPEQIWGSRGQEGIRRNLCDFGPRKLSVNHFLNIYNDNESGIQIVKKCIEELLAGDFRDMIGNVEHKDVVLQMKNKNDSRIGA